MMKIHGCKKCQGALVLDKDEFGWYEQCIQCGYTADIPLEKAVKKPQDTDQAIVFNPSERDLVKQWKQDKISSFLPIETVNNQAEDIY
jgi:hypothetical protein